MIKCWRPGEVRFILLATVSLLSLSVLSSAFCQTAFSPGPRSVIITSTKTFTWNTGPQGWNAVNDFRLKKGFTKLGGPHDGNAWITENRMHPQTYTEGAFADSEGYRARYPGPNLLLSPWFDLSNLHQAFVYISFQQSIAVEPGWDGGWMEYTTDGKHWNHLGTLDDPDGINWYSTKTYENAQTRMGDPPDTATMVLPRYQLYGRGTGIPQLPTSWWTSNGDPNGSLRSGTDEGSTPTGPFGWLFCQLKITASRYPEIFRTRAVRFRYVAFSDAVNPRTADNTTHHPLEGWAIDDFTIGPTGRK